MYLILGFVALIPAITYFVLQSRDCEHISRRQQVVVVTILFLIGLVPASPFITSRGVGSGEAYNYSLALADAVLQLRHGVIPLVGQTEYAFNGRIHPLRNAPYLFYLAGGLDLVTFRQLTFWQLQNLSLALSLVAAAFAAYAGLRWGTGCRRAIALILAAVYCWSPPLLGFTIHNLFMSIHAAVFVPLAFGAVVRHLRRPELLNDVVMAIALAAAWLAHPPIALWLSAVVVVVRSVILWFDPSWQRRAGLLGAAFLSIALAGFVFVSVQSLNSDLTYLQEQGVTHVTFVSSLMENLRTAFPANLLPVSRQADGLGDLQLGYAGWCLCGIALASLFVRSPRAPDLNRRWTIAGLLFSAGFLLVLALPVPVVTAWLWFELPSIVRTLSNVWPMQRIYVIAIASAMFAAALAGPSLTPWLAKRRLAWLCATLLLAGWTCAEAWKFISKGDRLMWSSDMTRHAHVLSNVNLTVTSYAFLPLPQTFLHGVMDPLFQTKLIHNRGQEVTSPLAVAQAKGTLVAQGEIWPDAAVRVQKTVLQSGRLLLQPGKRYLLSFDFHTPPFEGSIDIVGEWIRRSYLLPEAGNVHGFGMKPENARSVSLWTVSSKPEEVDVRFAISRWPVLSDPTAKLANFSLEEIDSETLPIRLVSLLPLRLSIDAPDDECYVSTPRSFIPGYEAFVNGRPTRAIKSVEGQVMIAVPKGHSEVRLRYPGPFPVQLAFWISASAWLGVFVWICGSAVGLKWRLIFQPVSLSIGFAGRQMARAKWVLMILAVAVTPVLVLRQQRQNYLNSVGPVRVTVLLPQKETGRQQPILVTGVPGAGAIVFVSYVDEDHIKVGADIWGALYESEPFRTDYFQEHEIVVNSSALYPLDHPRVKALSLHARNALREAFTVEYDGKIVLSHIGPAYESKIEQVTVGKTLIGGSVVQPEFAGKIIGVARLPLPIPLVVARDQKVRTKVRFPGERSGSTEPLVAVGEMAEQGVCAVSYLPGNRLRFLYRTKKGVTTESAVFDFEPKKTYELEFQFGRRLAEHSQVGVDVRFNGAPALAMELDPLLMPQTLHLGVSPMPVPGLQARFTGPLLTVSPSPGSAPSASRAHSGPMHLVVHFPTDRQGRSEPLLSTGTSGKADIIYVTYLDPTHVRFGLDHWGRAGVLSESIAIDYREPHEIELSLAPLYPRDSKDSAVLQRLRTQVEVRLDGNQILQTAVTGYDSTPADITPGQNRIGASTCDAAFTGVLHQVNRPPLSP